MVHHLQVGESRLTINCGCSSVVEHLLAKERVESSNLFIRLLDSFERINLLSFLLFTAFDQPFRVDLCVYRANLLR